MSGTTSHTAMDTVYIEGLTVEAVIGVHAWEREVRQTLVFDVELATDVRRAAASDALADAVDYFAISERLRELAASSDCQLIETLAERCADRLRSEFGVAWLRLRLAKPTAVPAARAVGIVIERGERPT